MKNVNAIFLHSLLDTSFHQWIVLSVFACVPHNFDISSAQVVVLVVAQKTFHGVTKNFLRAKKDRWRCSCADSSFSLLDLAGLHTPHFSFCLQLFVCVFLFYIYIASHLNLTFLHELCQQKGICVPEFMEILKKYVETVLASCFS